MRHRFHHLREVGINVRVPFSLFILAISLIASLANAAVSGQLKSSTDYYPSDLGPPTEQLAPYLNVTLEGKQKWTRKFRLEWQLYALANPQSESQPDQFYGDVPEAFVEYKLGDLRVRGGMNTLNWGVVDLSSPSDVVNPVALIHPLRIHKQGAPMAELDWRPTEVFNAHAVFIPRQRRTVLPSTDSRWLPRSFLVNTTGSEINRVVLPDPLEYTYGPPQDLDKALDNNAGLRLSSHLGSWDLFAMHFEGAAPSPKVFPTVVLDLGNTSDEVVARSPIELSIVSYRVRTSGFGVVWAGENVIARAETAYQHTISDNAALQPWSWASVAALETNVNMGSRTMTVLAQYYYTVNPQAADNMISSSYRLFDRTAVLGFRLPQSEKLLITGSVLYEGNTDGVFWLLGFEQKLSDSLRFGLGWRDFSAGKDGLLKTFERNDHATLDMTYFF